MYPVIAKAINAVDSNPLFCCFYHDRCFLCIGLYSLFHVKQLTQWGRDGGVVLVHLHNICHVTHISERLDYNPFPVKFYLHLFCVAKNVVFHPNNRIVCNAGLLQ